MRFEPTRVDEGVAEVVRAPEGNRWADGEYFGKDVFHICVRL